MANSVLLQRHNVIIKKTYLIKIEEYTLYLSVIH